MFTSDPSELVINLILILLSLLLILVFYAFELTINPGF